MSVDLCGAQHPTFVFSHYAYGDALPVYARFVGEESNDVREDEAITIYETCRRETGHLGRHLSPRQSWPEPS